MRLAAATVECQPLFTIPLGEKRVGRGGPRRFGCASLRPFSSPTTMTTTATSTRAKRASCFDRWQPAPGSSSSWLGAFSLLSLSSLSFLPYPFLMRGRLPLTVITRKASSLAEATSSHRLGNTAAERERQSRQTVTVEFPPSKAGLEAKNEKLCDFFLFPSLSLLERRRRRPRGPHFGQWC